MELTEEGIELAKMALETHDLWDKNDPGLGEDRIFYFFYEDYCY